MQKLERKAFAAAQPLLKDLAAIHVAVVAALEGVTDAELWVDDRTAPTIALLSAGDGYFLAGTPDRRRFSALKRRIPAWAYLFAEEPWTDLLGEVWANPFARPHPRVRMGLASGSSPLPATPPLPDGFSLRRISRSLLDTVPGAADALDGIGQWRSKKRFLDEGVGFCVLHDGKVVSHCLSDSVAASRCELGVGTEPDYRRLGLGRAAAAAAVAECLRRGIADIEWHSHASNRGSLAVARQIGLVELDRHVAYSGSLPAENVGDLDRDTCLDWARHVEAAAETIGWYNFHAAGAWALLGDRTRDIASLERLVDGGWDGEAEWLEDYWALQGLTGDAAFKAIVERQRAAETD